MVVDCPICHKSVEWNNENKYKPFCSSRCKLIDLGEWAEGNSRSIAGSEPVITDWDNIDK